MKPFLKIKDFSISGEEFELLHDEEFDMLVTKPIPKNLDSYYQSETYISHTDASTTFVDQVYQAVKRYSLGKKLRLITRETNGNKTLLDVGTGTGDFLVSAKEAGWTVNGVEPNKGARIKAIKKGTNVVSSLDGLPIEKYKVITLWHVLEHLPSIENEIAKIIDRLEKDGVLIIAVPNFKSRDAHHYKEFWAAYDVPRHLWHFSKGAIEKLFARHNMRLVKTKPMLFDAFYVSLLSEKYKSGKSGVVIMFKAFFQGIWSNIHALKTKEYSSMIYILKRN